MGISSDPRDALDAIREARSQSLTSVVHRELERRILAGEIAGGERFNEQSIAQALGVSRGPVREARRSLESAGFVVSIPGKGSFVRTLGEKELAENYDIRALLTGFACARMAESGEAGEKTALAGLVRQMEAASEAADDARYYALNVEFHDLVMAAARHDRAAQIYRDHIKETHLSRHKSLTRKENMQASNAEHAVMLEAILAGEPERARAAGEAHVLNGKQRWLRSMAGPPAQD